jgi:hypothetical protein
MLTPYFDVVRVSAAESDDEGGAGEEKAEHDYLSPFLPASGRHLQKEDALKVGEGVSLIVSKRAGLTPSRGR